MLCIGGNMDEETLTVAAANHRELRQARRILAELYPLISRAADLSAIDVVRLADLAAEARALLDDPQSLAQFAGVVGGDL